MATESGKSYKTRFNHKGNSKLRRSPNIDGAVRLFLYKYFNSVKNPTMSRIHPNAFSNLTIETLLGYRKVGQNLVGDCCGILGNLSA